MKIYNPLCLLAIGLFFTTYSQATINLGHLGWGETVSKNSAYIVYRKDYDPESKQRSIDVSVGHDTNGVQRFYITSSDTANSARCNIQLRPDTITMNFNDQAIKMSRFCRKFSDSSETYYSYTPSTEQGHSFIINLFKTSTAPVELIIDNETLYIPVKGFTRIWNNAGGNAI